MFEPYPSCQWFLFSLDLVKSGACILSEFQGHKAVAELVAFRQLLVSYSYSVLITGPSIGLSQRPEHYQDICFISVRVYIPITIPSFDSDIWVRYALVSLRMFTGDKGKMHIILLWLKYIMLSSGK